MANSGNSKVIHAQSVDRRPVLLSLVAHLTLLLILVLVRLGLPDRQRSLSLVAAESEEVDSTTTLRQTSTSKFQPPDVDSTEQPVDVVKPATLLAEAVTIPAADSLPDSSARSATFFGSRAYGNRFVFILDISVSMRARSNKRFYRARDELLRTVGKLGKSQEFVVVLFSHRFTPMFGEMPMRFVRADHVNLQRLKYWLEDVRLQSGTDPRRALSVASGLGPDAVFFLTDGGFNSPHVPFADTGWLAKQGNRDMCDVRTGVSRYMNGIPVHCISFENRSTFKMLSDIAGITGGSVRFVPAP